MGEKLLFWYRSGHLRSLTLEALRVCSTEGSSTLSNTCPIGRKKRRLASEERTNSRCTEHIPSGWPRSRPLNTFRFNSDYDLRTHIESNPCSKFELIFVWRNSSSNSISLGHGTGIFSSNTSDRMLLVLSCPLLVLPQVSGKKPIRAIFRAFRSGSPSVPVRAVEGS